MSADRYREVGYESRPSPERHPRRLWSVAKLRGLNPTPPDTARILDLGCGSGGFLLGIADEFRQSRCVGVDQSPSQIEAARRSAREGELGNVSFATERFSEISLEPFDYIICHGVFSWIPPDDRRRLLDCLKRSLAPRGICYLSFNALPGWQTRLHLKEMLSLFDRKSEPLSERVESANEVLQEIEGRLVDAFRPYGLQLKEEVERNRGRGDGFIAHELLLPHCGAHTVMQFCEEVGEKGFHLIGDGLPTRMRSANAEFNTESLPFRDDPVKVEQFFDYLYPTSFRGALLAHDDQIPQSIDQGDWSSLFLASPLVEHEDQALAGERSIVPFYGPQEEIIESREPEQKAVLRLLSAVWPQAVSFKDCEAVAKQQLGFFSYRRKKLVEQLRPLWFRNLLEVHPSPLRCASRLPSQPFAAPYRRHQAAEQNWIMTLRAEYLPVNPLLRELCVRCNGERSIHDLISEITRLVAEGELQVRTEDEEPSAEEISIVLQGECERALQYLAEMAVFEEQSGVAHEKDPT